MSVTVRLFATLRDVTGTGELDRPLAAPVPVEAVWQALVAEWPALAPHRAGISCAVNAEYAKFTDQVHAGDEVAFLPPVSGG
jgi:molybdopterin converting factor small subunit